MSDTNENLAVVKLNEEQHISMIAQKIDKSYREGVDVYTEALSNYSLEIDGLKVKIASLIKSKEKEEQELLDIQQKISQQELFLEKLNETFTQKVYSIDELKTQYFDMIHENEYAKILKRKTNELLLLQDEIEELEGLSLEKELARINLLVALTPKRFSIVELEERLVKLEREKEFYSLKKLHLLPQLAFAREETSAELTEIIEVDNSNL